MGLMVCINLMKDTLVARPIGLCLYYSNVASALTFHPANLTLMTKTHQHMHLQQIAVPPNLNIAT